MDNDLRWLVFLFGTSAFLLALAWSSAQAIRVAFDLAVMTAPPWMTGLCLVLSTAYAALGVAFLRLAKDSVAFIRLRVAGKWAIGLALLIFVYAALQGVYLIHLRFGQ